MSDFLEFSTLVERLGLTPNHLSFLSPKSIPVKSDFFLDASANVRMMGACIIRNVHDRLQGIPASAIEADVSGLGGAIVTKGKEPNGLKRLEARLTDKRAPFSAYLMGHFDAFTGVLNRVGRHWDEIAKWAYEEGHTGKTEISPDTARKAYERERSRRSKLSEAAPLNPTPKPELPVRATIPGVKIMPEVKPVPNNDAPLDSLNAGRWIQKGGKR